MTNRRLLLVLTLVTLLLLLMVGGGVLTLAMVSGGSAGGTLASRRSVMTSSDSVWLESRFTSDTAYINASGHKIVVAPAAVLVDGRMLASLDAAAKDVQISVRNHEVRVIADGKVVAPSIP
jgi:hypothetical protein